jgi:methionine S-methyltransferase
LEAKGMNLTIQDFNEQCHQSSNHAYDLFKKLLAELDEPKTRKSAFHFLCSLKQYNQINKPKDINFQFLQQNILDKNDETVCLNLLQFPSTFLPEAWSFTFYEGLVRYPHSEYSNKNIIELGCGIGWISIALAIRYSPQKMTGLDINPKAITCARLNLYLNALNEDGSEKLLNNADSLLKVVTFHESNLFSHFTEENIDSETKNFDKIIGCIPQVLNPEPEVMESLIAESASDEYLHSLSNYFAKQGFIEDQFGLGLIASAVEQSIPLLRSDGKLILNLGGRPGRAVLERLMHRRGFKVRRVWQTQVEQAADTEISALVDIEKNTGHRFEFYMSNSSDLPIDARAALKYANAGGKIYHSVDVYEAKLLFPEQVKSIYHSIDQLTSTVENDKINQQFSQGLRSAVDLTFDNYSDAEERYSFLAFLAKQLHKINHFPYQDTAGLTYFRQQLAEYFRYYLRVDVTAEQMVITPGRRQLIASLLSNYRPKLTLVSRSLAHLVEASFDTSKTEVIQTPSRIEYLIELIVKLKPQIVIAQLEHYESQSSKLFEQLVESAIKHNVLLVVDLTENIDLSSEPDIHGVYRYLSDNALSDNLVLMAGLINNCVYQNYSLNITLTSNSQVSKYLVDAAELTYSRTPVLKQLYYAHLLESLLYFQRTRPTEVKNNVAKNKDNEFLLPLHKISKSAFSHPAIEGNRLLFNENTIRLDFGENELATPLIFKEALLESYLVRKWGYDEANPEELLIELLRQRFNLPQEIYSKIIFGNGVAPIYSGLLNLCVREAKSLVIPSGSYGYFKAAAEYKDIDVCVLKTDEVNTFKITPEELEACLSVRKGCWLFLNAPIVNPTGAIYSKSELSNLLSITEKYDVTVIMDCIFMGLEFDESLNWDLSDYLSKKISKLIIIGGISKEYAAGGLRFGYAWSKSKNMLNSLENELSHSPHFTLGYAVRKLIDAQLNKNMSLSIHLRKQRSELSRRAIALEEILTKNGWKVIKPHGGLFLVAKPQRFIEDNQLLDEVGGDQITEKLFKDKNLVINNSTWTGLPGYCRFVLSCSDEEFNQALERLTEFDLLS